MKNPTQNPAHLPTIRKESDLIAFTAHTLGYWPSSSLALLTTYDQATGPILRIDLDLTQPHQADQAAHIIADTLRRSPGQPGKHTTLLALFFGPAPLTQEDKQPSPAQLSTDRQDAQTCYPFVTALETALKPLGQKLTDAIYIGAESHWGVLKPQQAPVLAGNNSEILSSYISFFFVLAGTGLLKTRSELLAAQEWKFNPQEPTTLTWAQEAKSWLEAYSSPLASLEFTSHQHYLQQFQAQITLWNYALTQLDATINKTRRQVKKSRGRFIPVTDLTQETVCKTLDPQLLGYLLATLTKEGFIIHLLNLAITDQTSALETLHACQETTTKQPHTPPSPLLLPLGNSTHPGLNRLIQDLLSPPHTYTPQLTPEETHAIYERTAQTLTGTLQHQQPNWRFIDALEIICHISRTLHPRENQHNTLGILAWISWMKGCSSAASTYIEEAENHPDQEPFFLLHALKNSVLPAIALDPTNSWGHHYTRLNNPPNPQIP